MNEILKKKQFLRNRTTKTEQCVRFRTLRKSLFPLIIKHLILWHDSCYKEGEFEPKIKQLKYG